MTKKVARKTKSKSKLSQWLNAFLLSSFVILGIMVFGLWKTVKSPIPLTQESRVVTVVKGQTYYKLLDIWQEKGLIRYAPIAKLYTKFFVKNDLKQGVYQLTKGHDLTQVLQSFTGGEKAAMVTVRIIEGKRTEDLLALLSSTEGVTKEVSHLPMQDIKDKLQIKEAHLEGVFSPNTYFFAKNTSDLDILMYLYKQQQKILQTAWKNRAKDLPYKTPYEALIMASIIEKETGIASERNLVSAVFVNRLRKGMKLQTDPTVIYGMGKRYDGDIRKKDLREATPYNTYVIKGLPPTPIALPSKEAIEATLHPADSDALFFVATGNGGHTFTKTYAEHKRAVAVYLKVMQEKKNK